MHDEYWEDRKSGNCYYDRDYRRQQPSPDLSDLKIEIYRLKFEIEYLKKSLESAQKGSDSCEKLIESVDMASSEDIKRLDANIDKNHERLNEKLDEMDRALFKITEKVDRMDNTRFEDSINEKFGSKTIGDVLSKITTMNILGVINLVGLIIVLGICIANMLLKL